MMNGFADISAFTNLLVCGSSSCVFNETIEEMRKRYGERSRLHKELSKAKRSKRLSLIGALASSVLTAGALGAGVGLDYLGGHKDSLPVQPTPGLERVADAVRGGVNAIRGTADNSELTDLETQLKKEQLLRAFEQAEKMRERTRRLRTERELNGTKIAKENWKQADLNRGRYTDSEGKQDIGFGDAFKQGLKNNYGSIIAKLLRGAGGTK